MAEHLIRLRGGWEAIELESDERRPRRISLPGQVVRGLTGRVRLVRRFGRPHLGGPDETLSLRMERVPGLASAALNGHPLAVASMAHDSIEIRPIKLLDRNELILEVDAPVTALQDAAGPRAWGEVALVITRVSSAGSGSWRDSCDRLG